MKKLIASGLVAMILLSGCNTINGLGKDMSNAGDAISNSAQKTQNKM